MQNIFMICREEPKNAYTDLGKTFSFRNLRSEELELWKAMPFDSLEEYYQYKDFMDDYYQRTYTSDESLFYKNTYVVNGASEEILGTCTIWRAYGAFNSIHWLKVKKEYEGLGIGRALLTKIFKGLNKSDYPVYLHTQPESYRAIKLYSDFGFKILKDKIIGPRINEYRDSLSYLRTNMPEQDFVKLKFGLAPKKFIKFMETVKDDQF